MPKIATGHHGTSRAASSAIAEHGFKASSKPEDWLGDGVYFFQDAPLRAREWAVRRFGTDAVVVECEIDVSLYLDLLDMGSASWLATVHDEFLKLAKASGIPLPVQRGGAHRLDREILNFAVEKLIATGQKISGIRGAFAEGKSVFPNSALAEFSHVQIAVRDLSTICSCRIMPDSEIEDAGRLPLLLQRLALLDRTGDDK